MDVVAAAAATLAQDLVGRGAPGLHLYCLNRADVVAAVLERLDLSVWD